MADAEVFRRIAEIDGSVAFVLDWPALSVASLSAHADDLLGGVAPDWGRLLPVLDAPGPHWHEVEWTCADGHVQALAVHAERCGDQVIGLIRDHTPQREMRLSQKRFASMLNHEFRTPLATIDGAVQRLEATGQQHDAPTRQRYQKIQAAVDRLTGMLDDYLSPDRLALTGHKPVDRKVSPASLIEEAAGLVRAAGRRVECSIGPLPAVLRSDPAGLRLALKILVENAIQYAPPPAVITLSGATVDSGLELLVIDNGFGIVAEDLPKIFDKGFRGSNAQGQNGKGMGLYMARSVLEVQGGSLKAQRLPEGGMCFRIWLPGPPEKLA